MAELSFRELRQIMQKPERKQMSLSNPTNNLPNPCKRWFEWNGEKGSLRWFDKEKKENVEVSIPFQFILLDRLNTISGWHNNSESNIYSNEIRSTLNESLVVKSFKMLEPIATGFYSDIKDKVKANGGKFTINLYIAFTNEGGELELGSLRVHGAAMSAWINFENDKTVRPLIDKKGIKIASTLHGEKGTGKKKIEWEAPVFELADVPSEVIDDATGIDRALQTYLAAYFKRNKVDPPATEIGDERVEDRTSHQPAFEEEF